VTQPEDSPIIQQLREYGLAARVALEVAQLGETLLARTQESGTEFAAMVDADSGARVGAMLGGKTDAVNISAHIAAMKPGRQYVHLHTHPGSSSFSGRDVATFIAHGQIQTMGVVGADGTWYLIARTVRTPSMAPREVVAAWQLAIESLDSRYNILIRTMPQLAAWRQVTHEALASVANQFDLWYTRVETTK